MTKIIKVQEAVNPQRFLTIVQKGDTDKYYINVTSGSIENPSKSAGATWFNLYDKYHTADEVQIIVKQYGIDADIKSLLNN